MKVALSSIIVVLFSANVFAASAISGEGKALVQAQDTFATVWVDGDAAETLYKTMIVTAGLTGDKTIGNLTCGNKTDSNGKTVAGKQCLITYSNLIDGI